MDAATLGDKDLTEVLSFILQGPHRAVWRGMGLRAFHWLSLCPTTVTHRGNCWFPAPVATFKGEAHHVLSLWFHVLRIREPVAKLSVVLLATS